MPLDIAFKVGDQLQCINQCTGNGIVVARSAINGDITYTVFTDYGNTIKISEIEMLDRYKVIEHDPVYEELYVDPDTNIRRWLQDRAELISSQTYEYYSVIRKLSNQSE